MAGWPGRSYPVADTGFIAHGNHNIPKCDIFPPNRNIIIPDSNKKSVKRNIIFPKRNNLPRSVTYCTKDDVSARLSGLVSGTLVHGTPAGIGQWNHCSAIK